MTKKLFFLFFALLSLYGYGQKYLIEEDVNKDTLIPKLGFQRNIDIAGYIGYGIIQGSSVNGPPSGIRYGLSYQINEGFWVRKKITQKYSVGAFMEFSRESFRLLKPIIGDSFDRANTVISRQINNNLAFGLFNRMILTSNRFFVDAGIYYTYDVKPRLQTVVKPRDQDYSQKKVTYNKPSFMNRHNLGINFKITFSSVSIYGRYRITNLYKNENYDLPKWICGVSVDFRD